ncbi:Alpha/Beta hydrolase protein [Xylogone sp. PMI_703]|nr:Alpha/Beta hydrolase protein [Xylogone sp. PMI_703]
MPSHSIAAYLLLALATDVVSAHSTKIPSPAHLGDVSILAADDLITTNIPKTTGAVLLNSPGNWFSAQSSCEALSEALWSPKHQNFNAGLNNSLAYEVYSGRFESSQLFWIGEQGGTPSHGAPLCPAMDVKAKVHQVSCANKLPALCTQNAPASNITFANTAPAFQVAQKVGSQTLIGYRDFLTFRFIGVRFAKEPERFTYSSLYDSKGTNYALNPAPECLQPPNAGSTDCLFLNIWTTLLPAAKRPAKKDLKPVMVYIYGGGFTTGSASNPTNDGGNTAARGDVVVVDIAYRLGTLGFLAFKDGVHNGNYWISDCIAGLQWVQKYIENFGGDPSRVTIYGESAGAETVQALLASPMAKGLFRGAIMQSNYYQPYAPIASSYNRSTLPILQETGCIDARDQIACLRAYNATELINLKTNFNYPVMDGKYLTSSYIKLDGHDRHSPTNSVPVLMGVNRDEGGVLSTLYQTDDLTTGIEDVSASQGLNSTAILASKAFSLGNGPNPSNLTLDVFNTTTRIYTDNSFRCANQFTAYAGVKSGVLPHIWFYEFNRTYQDPAYNVNGVCGAPVTKTHPFGDPSAEYFKCHAGDLANTFGNVARVGFPERDGNDMPFAQVVVDYWTAFGRNLNPNPDLEYLKVRGYWNTINQIKVSGKWDPVNWKHPKMMELQWNSFMAPFRDEQQCAVLGYPLDLLA